VLIRALEGTMSPSQEEFHTVTEVPGNHVTMVHESNAKILAGAIENQMALLEKRFFK
jgi:hypothetical protein